MWILPENLTFPQTLYIFPRKGLGRSDDLIAAEKQCEFDHLVLSSKLCKVKIS